MFDILVKLPGFLVTSRAEKYPKNPVKHFVSLLQAAELENELILLMDIDRQRQYICFVARNMTGKCPDITINLPAFCATKMDAKFGILAFSCCSQNLI